VEPEPEPEIPEAEVVDEPEPEEVIVVPFEPAPVEAAEVVEVPSPGEPIPDDVVVSVPFDVEEPEPPVEEPLPDQDAWSNLLAELQTESVQPDASLPVLPETDEPRPAELSYELGISLDAFAANLNAAPEPEPEVVEEELGMSLAELEESLKRERPQ
jgi:hypothetical protein